jgi:signal transduction histidine kinase
MSDERDAEALAEEVSALRARLQDAVDLYQQESPSALTLDARRRIAEDLHDRVIQRIFAASLQVHQLRAELLAAQAGEGQLPAPESFTAVMRELDEASREARASIYTLTQGPAVSEGEQAVRDTASRATLILGVAPVVSVSGNLEEI